MIKQFKEEVIALVSGAMFLFLLFILKINLIIAIIFTLLIFIGAIIIFSEERDNYNFIEQQVAYKIDNTVLRDRLNNSKLIIYEVSSHIQDLNGQVKNKVQRICFIAERIFENVAKSPCNTSVVKKLFSYYLDSLNRILSLYRELSKHERHSAEVDILLYKVERVLDQVIVVFEQYEEKSLQNKVFNLDTELQLLKETMRMEV